MMTYTVGFKVSDTGPHIDEIIKELMRTTSIFSTTVEAIFTLHDYVDEKLIFVSEAFTETTGVGLEEARRRGSLIYTDIIHPKDIDLVKAAYDKSRELFFPKRRKDSGGFIFATNFRLRTARNSYLQVDGYSIPVVVDENEYPIVGANIMKPTERKSANHFIVRYPESNQQLYYSRKLGSFVSAHKIELKEIEIQILRLSAEGLNEQSISRKLNIKKNLVNHYKRNIFHKLYVNTMSQAVYVALITNLI